MSARRIIRVAWTALALALAAGSLGLWLAVSAAGEASPGRLPDAPGDVSVSGVVYGSGGPQAGAHVRVRATDNLTFTDALGHFVLTGLTESEQIEITAWYSGYYIAGTHVTPSAELIGRSDAQAIQPLSITLRPYHTADHPSYAWVSPISGTSAGACGNCHPMIMPQWTANAHGQAVSNDRFFSLYEGTNLSGTAVVSPGYTLDFPGTSGNCANCHAPGAGVDGYLTTAMGDVRGVITAGIQCDFCHKVGGVYLDPATGSVYANVPGVQSQRVLRPPPGDNIFIGPFDDIPDPDTYLPLYDKSQYCAPCHQFSFWGTPIYESFAEWLASDYAAAGVICQDCHMAPTGDRYFALPSVGGLAHPPESIPSHLQPGASDAALLQETVTMRLALAQVGDLVRATVTITNTGAGHHVPTDHPGRHLILALEVTGGQGQVLDQVSGPTVPTWGGDQAGAPGVVFAKVLQDARTGQYPIVSYWKQSFIYSDNRIPALAADTSTYFFRLPSGSDGSTVTANARLIFRRLFQDLADQKGWQSPDMLMETYTTTLTAGPSLASFLPALMKADR